MSSRTLRITVINNNDTSEVKMISLPQSSSLSDLVRLAGQKLGIQAQKCFMENGALVDDIAMLRDNDTCLVSCGEPFFLKGSRLAKTQHTSMDSFKLAILGPGSVGKSAITLKFAQGVFINDYDPTIEDVYRKSTAVDGTACMMDILDTAGQEDYAALRATWMRDRDGFLLVYSATDRSSYGDLSSFFDQLAMTYEDVGIPPFIVVCNKCDVQQDFDGRQVSEQEGRQLAASFGLDEESGYFETSAKTGFNIEGVFHSLVRQIRMSQSLPTGGGGGGGGDGASSASTNKSYPPIRKKSLLERWCTIL
jgi:small GTP-binding protein